MMHGVALGTFEVVVVVFVFEFIIFEFYFGVFIKTTPANIQLCKLLV